MLLNGGRQHFLLPLLTGRFFRVFLLCLDVPGHGIVVEEAGLLASAKPYPEGVSMAGLQSAPQVFAVIFGAG